MAKSKLLAGGGRETKTGAKYNDFNGGLPNSAQTILLLRKTQTTQIHDQSP